MPYDHDLPRLRRLLRDGAHRALGGRSGPGCPSAPRRGAGRGVAVLVVGAGCVAGGALAGAGPRWYGAVLGATSVAVLVGMQLAVSSARWRASTTWEQCGCQRCVMGWWRRWWERDDPDVDALVDSVRRRHGHRGDGAENGGRRGGAMVVQVAGVEQRAYIDPGDPEGWTKVLSLVLARREAVVVDPRQAAALVRCLGRDTAAVAGPLDDDTARLAQMLCGTLPLEEAVGAASAATG